MPNVNIEFFDDRPHPAPNELTFAVGDRVKVLWEPSLAWELHIVCRYSTIDSVLFGSFDDDTRYKVYLDVVHIDPLSSRFGEVGRRWWRFRATQLRAIGELE